MKKLFQNHKAKVVIESSQLNQKLNKIQSLLLYLLILFIPTQFGPHFWPDFSFIKGIRIDYLSPTLYVTDIIISIIFIICIIQKFRDLFNRHSGERSDSGIISFWRFWTSQNDKNRIVPLFQALFFLVILIGIIFSKSPSSGLYGFVKLLEFVFLGIYTSKNIGKLKFENVLLMFSVGIIFESFLAIFQYFNHGSINGIFYFFGERFFNSQTPGIANASLNGELFLRPYGTFPHPNVLAGYLTIAMAIVISNLKNQISKMRKVFYCSTILFGTVALFLTLSRVAIILWIIILGIIFIKRFVKTKLKISSFYFLPSIIALGIISFLLINSPLKSRFTSIHLSDEAVVQRQELIKSSFEMINSSPLFGVGLNNFLINLSQNSIIQPVHSIFLLVASETGIIGLGFFLWFLIKAYRRINSSFIIYPLSLIIILGLFDHYFLTLQQGQLLFSFILGLCWSRKATG